MLKISRAKVVAEAGPHRNWVANLTRSGASDTGRRPSAALDTSDPIWDDDILSVWARRLFWLFGVALGLTEAVASGLRF